MTAVSAQDYCAQVVRDALAKRNALPPLSVLSDQTGLDVREVRAIVIAVRESMQPPADPVARAAAAVAEARGAVTEARGAVAVEPETTPDDTDQEPETDDNLVTSDLDVIAAGLTAYADHASLAVRNAASQARAYVEDLQDALRRHDAEAGLRERLAQLEAEAGAIRAQLGITDAPGETVECDVCGKPCKTAGLAVHKARAHKGAS